MKNKLFFLVLVIISAAFLFSGCMTKASLGFSLDNKGVFGEQIRTPAKDFVSLGLVFTEVHFVVTNKGMFSGETFAYQALLREAHVLGADAIINVVIDKQTQNLSPTMSPDIQHTYYGSALAIKFTETLKRTSSVTIRDDNSTTTTTTESIEFNGGGETVEFIGAAVVPIEQSAPQNRGIVRRK